uniref:Uncharacterized protein n=1 Tax=Octopus bimaculoides TaxID=37653 RepID=A0A0L8HED5_OCTBM
MDNCLQEYTTVNRERIEISDYLNNEDQIIINRILDLLDTEGTGFMCDFKNANQWRLNQETSKVNNVLKHIETKNIT